MYLWRQLVNNCGMCGRGERHQSSNNWDCSFIMKEWSTVYLDKKKRKSHFSSCLPLWMIHNCCLTFSFTPHWCCNKWGEASPSASVEVSGYRGLSQTYSLVLLGGPEREPAMDGYLDTCFFRGQDAANMAPPRTSRRDPPQAMKMAAPNSNLGQIHKEKFRFGPMELFCSYKQMSVSLQCVNRPQTMACGL